MQVETRALSEIREIDEAEHAAHIRLVTYNRADTYGSTWLRGVFDESLASGHVPAVWGHDRNQIFGSVREYDLKPDYADVNVGFADMEAVPLARSVYSLMKDRHVRQSSFGFSRVPGGTISKRSDPNFTPSQPGERERMAKANLVEVSVVLKGSVPDNGVLGVRADPALPAVDVDIAGLVLARAPHGFRSEGDAASCMLCGKPEDDPVHTMSRQTILDLAAAPVLGEDPHVLIRAADAALDAALGLLVPDDAGSAALGLLMAADAMLDRSQDLLELPDADGDDGPVGALARAFADPQPAWEGVTPNGDKIVVPAEAEQPPPDAEPDEVERALQQILTRRDPKKPYGDVTYADPGYQDDNKKRYPLDSEQHVRAALTYIAQDDNRKAYTADQLTAIEGRIRAAAKRYGIEVSAGKG